LSGMNILLNDVPASGEIRASGGETVSVTLQWDVLGRLPLDYSYFVHLIPVGGEQPVAQSDSALGAWGLPSGAWREGDSWQDYTSFVLLADLAAGDYELWLGVYNYADGTRLPIQVNGAEQADNRLLIGRIRIER